jgi:hypothetical protein
MVLEKNIETNPSSSNLEDLFRYFSSLENVFKKLIARLTQYSNGQTCDSSFRIHFLTFKHSPPPLYVTNRVSDPAILISITTSRLDGQASEIWLNCWAPLCASAILGHVTVITGGHPSPLQPHLCPMWPRSRARVRAFLVRTPRQASISLFL